ncbi:hypothetical protein FAE01_RS07880 [Enterococcus hirae]
MIPKFRALNIKTGFWFDEQELVFCDGKWFQNWRSFEDDFPLDMRDCVVVQSTGLKDKNGAEIFEGDVVLFSISDGFNHLVNEKAIVQASGCHSGLVCKLIDLDLEYRIYYDPVFHTDYEVIGNIYENSELLEEQR